MKMDKPTLVIMNTDDSPSMFWDDFDKAIAGGKQVIEHLKENHVDHRLVDIQLWYNQALGVSCKYKGSLADEIPEEMWESAHHKP